jgi:hypothetical protein
MTLNAHHDPMTDAQRSEIKRLCQQADIPDKSGELLTREGARRSSTTCAERSANLQRGPELVNPVGV